MSIFPKHPCLWLVGVRVDAFRENQSEEVVEFQIAWAAPKIWEVFPFARYQTVVEHVANGLQ